jgi:hypothetical protein
MISETLILIQSVQRGLIDNEIKNVYSPYDQLVMTYASVELPLHAEEHFLRGLCFDLFLLSVSPSARVLLRCVQFLSDIQEVGSQLLQLTAGNADQCRIKGRQPIK